MTTYPLEFKAAVLEKNNRPLAVETVVFEGPLQPGQVLVRVHYSGICGKQLEEISAAAGPDKFLPHMLGHEGSGIVEDTGPGVTTVKPGDTVVMHWMKGAGIDSQTPLYKYKRSGQRVNAGWITTFNEYAVVAENRVTAVASLTDIKTACLLGCAVTTGVGAVFNEACVRPGEAVAVFGCGGVGLNVIQGARIVNAYPIIAVDRLDQSLDMAKRLGATHVINSAKEDVQAKMKRVLSAGAEQVFVVTASPQAAETAVQAASCPGHVYFVAVPPVGAAVNIRALDIHRKKTLTGSCGGGIIPDRDIPRYLGLASRGLLELEGLITQEVSLRDINSGIEKLQQGHSGRCVVKICEG